MLKKNCNGCHGPCRCEYKYRICVTANATNHVPVLTPTEKGCPLVLESSRLIVKCKCCPVNVVDIADPLVMGDCIDTYLDLDLNDMNLFFLDVVDVPGMQAMDCSLRYQLFVNGQPYLAGIFDIDWTFS